MKGSPWLLVLIAWLALAGCVAPGAVGTGSVTAVLSAAGPNVFVNGRPARSGMPIQSGDAIRTGPGSSALIRWSEGTTIQLDQNSDPLLVWREGVLYVNCGLGWFLIDTGRMVVRVENELAEVLVGSRLALAVTPGWRFDAYLLQGRADVVRPPGRPLVPGEKVLIGSSGILAYAPIAPAERQEIEQRFARWTFAAAPEAPPPWLGQATAVAIGGIFAGSDEPQEPSVPAGGGIEQNPTGSPRPVLAVPITPGGLRAPLRVMNLPVEPQEPDVRLEQNPLGSTEPVVIERIIPLGTIRP